MVSIEELRKKFIVNTEEYEKEKLPYLVEKMSVFCKVSEAGNVHFEHTKLDNIDRILLFLASRFIAEKLNSKISSTVKLDELSSSLNIQKNIVSARLKELINRHFIDRKNGSYFIYPYKIFQILEKIDKKYRE